ncbi:MAG TPA: prolyl oligopeptidase family serine peptidase [Gemmatimonadaceae bacterium]|nr:prolyl oligopeptidase family serine peptidase [Gemmatimonadaceae bacterium]
MKLLGHARRKLGSAGARWALALVCAGAGAAAPARASGQRPSAPTYPESPRGGQIEDVGGMRIADPYRWLEAVQSPAVTAWVTAQNAATERYLARLPRRAEIRDLAARAWNYQKFSTPFVGGDRLFFYENAGLENQPVLYVQDKPELGPRVLLDPNAFSPDGLMAVVDQSASPDGRYLAYAVSTDGSAWREVHVRDVRTSQDLADELHGIKDSPLAWTFDARGFFYVRTDESRRAAAGNPLAPDGRQQVLFHRLGQPQSRDQVIFDDPEHPAWRLRAQVSNDGQYLVITARVGAAPQNRLYFIDLDDPGRPHLDAPVVKLFDDADAQYEFVASDGPLFFVRTTLHAPRGRLAVVDINTPDESHWTTLVRESYDPIVDALRVDDRIVVERVHDAHSTLDVYAFDGSPPRAIALPGAGTVTGLSADPVNRRLYYAFSSFLQPPVIYRYDLAAATPVVQREPWVDSTLSRFETTQLFVTSKDGTRVPMFITTARDVKLDGNRPTLLVGGGGFGAALTPAFSPEVAAWLELGGIYAAANVRGGGEYGRAWHDSGAGAHYQNAVDDVIAAAQFLVDQRYTRAATLAIGGRGSAGLLAASAAMERPDLFGAVAVDAGIFDMARFDRFTCGASWIPEFGSPEKPADLAAMLQYSPLENVKAGDSYPATMLSVGAHDEVSTPIHSYKLAAALQYAQHGPAPILLRVDYAAGAGPGTPVDRQIARAADELAFLADALHLTR